MPIGTTVIIYSGKLVQEFVLIRLKPKIFSLNWQILTLFDERG